jgi:hypothetical protein
MKFSFALFLLFQTTRILSFASEVNIYNEGLACFYMLASFPELANLPHGKVKYLLLFNEDISVIALAVDVIISIFNMLDLNL